MPELPNIFLHGLDLLNRGEYFEAHEVIEAAWRAEPGKIRRLYQGILQVAVVYYHITHGNYTGARKVVRRAISNLATFIDYESIDVPEIIDNLNIIDARLEMSGSLKGGEFNPTLLRPVRLRQ
jgi:hypothetical protein